jgi:hypothetical protein
LFVQLYQISPVQVSRCLSHVDNQVKSHFCFLKAATRSWFAPPAAELQKNGACLRFLGARLKSHFYTRRTEPQNKLRHTNTHVASSERSQASGPRSQTCPRFFFRSSPAMGVGRSARSRELLVGAPKWCTWTLGYLLDVSGPLLLSQNPGLGPKGKALSFLGPKNALSLPCCLCHFCFSVCLFYRFPSDNVCFFIYIERKKKTRCTTAEFECVQRTHVMTEIFEISG